MRYFEDFVPGQVYELGSRSVSAEQIVAFAREFDPQPFHVDEAAARSSPFGGLIASGWHTCAIFTRLLVDSLLADSASMGSPGVEEVRWPKPVRPGDVLTGQAVVLEARASERNPIRGTVKFEFELRNAAGEHVFLARSRGLFRRRET